MTTLTCPLTHCQTANEPGAESCRRCSVPLRGYGRLSGHAAQLFNDGLNEARAGRLSAARDRFAAVVHWSPHDTEARSALALAALQLGAVEDARRQWRTVLTERPEDPRALRGLELCSAAEPWGMYEAPGPSASEPASGAEEASVPEPESESAPEPESELVQEPAPAPERETESEEEPELTEEARPEPELEVAEEAPPELEPEPAPERKGESVPEPGPNPESAEEAPPESEPEVAEESHPEREPFGGPDPAKSSTPEPVKKLAEADREADAEPRGKQEPAPPSVREPDVAEDGTAEPSEDDPRPGTTGLIGWFRRIWRRKHDLAER